MHLNSQQVNRLLIGVTAIVFAVGVGIFALAIAAQFNVSARSNGSALASPSIPLPTVQVPVATAKTPPPLTSPRGAPLDAYRGLASWVDIYDTPAWRDPTAAIEDMQRHGVRTLFVQTTHFNAPDPFFNKKALLEFISAGHAHGMKVVAWYLPNMKPGSVDYPRVVAAIKLRTADGQAFDSFALDIESNAIHNEWERNAGLEALSKKIRAYAGPTYPLGAITPAPIGLVKVNSVWHNFPYTMVARYYDVFLPMGYWTYHGHSAAIARRDTRYNIALIRSKPGCEAIPIHVIGGEAESATNGQVQAFATAVREGGCVGASLYGWAGTTPPMWKTMSTIKP
jgi:hypothetical protein